MYFNLSDLLHSPPPLPFLTYTFESKEYIWIEINEKYAQDFLR